MRGAWMLLAALALAGCSRNDDSDKAAAARTMETYMRALKDGDCKKAYGCLSWKRRKEITLAEVEADYAAHRDRYHYRAGGKVANSFPYDGFKVFLEVVNGDGNVEFVSVVSEDGQWRIDEMAPSLHELLPKGRVAAPGAP